MDFLFDPQLLTGVVQGRRYERQDKSESYVSVPPAYLITDSDGAMWTLGTQYIDRGGGEFEFNVLRDDVDMGETAMRIEYRNGVVRIFGKEGWKSFSRSRRGFI